MAYLDDNGEPLNSAPARYLDDNGEPISVASQARKRLAGRGLTSEQVKAGGGVTQPDDITFDPRKSSDSGFVGNLLNPMNVVRGVAGAAKKYGGELMDIDNPLAPLTVPPKIGYDMLIGGPIEMGNEIYRRNQANEGSADLYGQATQAGVLTAAGMAAPKVLPKFGASLKGSQAARYAKHTGIPEELAQELIDNGVKLKNPRTDLADYAESRAAAVDTDTPILDRPQAAQTKPIIEAIHEAREQLYSEPIEVRPAPADPTYLNKMIASLEKKYPTARVKEIDGNVVVQNIRHPDMESKVARLGQLQDHINSYANRGMVTNENLRNMTQDYNYAADAKGAYGENAPTNPVRMPADANVAHAVRDVVKQDSASAVALGEKSRWLTVKQDVAPQAIKISPANVPDVLKSVLRLTGKGALTAVAGAVGGPGVAKLLGGLLGAGEVTRLIKQVVTSPAYVTGSAIFRSNVGKMLAAGDYSSAARLTGVAGGESGMLQFVNDYGHDAALHDTVVAAMSKSGGDPNVARQVLHGKRAVIQYPDGTEVPVPDAITRATFNQLR